MKDKAYGKINLALDVFAIRDDGYHDIDSIMVPIVFFDDLEININDKEEDRYFCNRKFLKFDENNSIVKMLSLLREKYHLTDYYDVSLRKRIPIKAGLGGGTADAAGTLRILKRMYNLNISEEEIKELCLKVGADVLFNYYNIPGRVRGMGDEIEPIEIKKDYSILLVKPRSGVSTKKAYDLLDMKKCDHPDIDKLCSALKNGDSIDGLLGNSLQESSMRINKDICIIIEELKEAGLTNVLMSGSGSTVFAISENEEDIKRVYKEFYGRQYYVRFSKLFRK